MPIKAKVNSLKLDQPFCSLQFNSHYKVALINNSKEPSSILGFGSNLSHEE